MFKVNLIPYNPTDSAYTGSSPKAVAAFRDELERRGLDATVRVTRGRDIDAACGQLAARSPCRLAHARAWPFPREVRRRIGALLCALVAAAHLKLGTPLSVM